MSVRSGFEQTIQGLTVRKDTEAQLIYALDWVDLLPVGDSLATQTFTITARANDPDPLAIHSQGISGTRTFVELKQGQEGKVYAVSCLITTANGLIDRRTFRVKVERRSA